MRPVMILAFSAAVLLLFCSYAYISRNSVSQIKTKPGAGGFAVLELFTSEGCSSCPAADAVAARIQREAGDRPIYVLAYHVDYWNRLGWKDVFSKAEYSKRQYEYSRLFTGQVYTPQLIINGRSECIGSDESAVSKSVNNALNAPSSVTLNLQGQLGSREFDLDYVVSGKPGNSRLLFAIVQKHAVSKVTRGENEGRTLSHAQIVNTLVAIDLPSGNKGSEHLMLPEGFNTRDWEIVGFVQSAESGVITAAARAQLNLRAEDGKGDHSH